MAINTTPENHPTPQTREYPKNTPEKITLPTIGRVVYAYHPGIPKPHAAIVADCEGYVVNLGVLGHDGVGFTLLGVQHIETATQGAWCWDWMPSQKGQAAKTEELEKLIQSDLAAAPKTK